MKIETFIEEDTRYKKHCAQDNHTSVSSKVGAFGPRTGLPIAISCIVTFSWIWPMVRNLFPILVLGKARSHRTPNLGSRGGWVTWVIWWFAKNCTTCDAWAGTLLWWSCQSPVVHSCSLLNYLNTFHGEMFKLNAKLDANSLLYLLRHFESNSHTAHMLTQQCLLPPLMSTVKLSLFMHEHSSPLSLAARLHPCHASRSHYIYNDWAFAGQTLYTSGYYWLGLECTSIFSGDTINSLWCIPQILYSFILADCHLSVLKKNQLYSHFI